MEKYLVVFIAFLEVASGIRGKTLCKDPIWNVFENHYVPWEICPFKSIDFKHKSSLHYKYYKKLSENQTRPFWSEIDDILSDLLKLHPTESAEAGNKHVLASYACKAGDKIMKYLTNAKWEEDRIFKLIYNIYRDFFDKDGLVVNVHMRRIQEKMKKGGLTAADNFEYICSAIMDASYEPFDDLYRLRTEIQLPNNTKPPVVKPVLPKTTKSIKVIHISDIHLDKKYVVGSWANCDKPVCCKKSNKPPNEKAGRAGKFGSWKCDTPVRTFEDLLSHIKKRHKDAAYVIWTGDALAHETGIRDKFADMSTVSKTVSKLSQILSGIKTYPTIGHVGPVSTLWLVPKNRIYKFLAVQWARWLPNSALKDVRWGGYYTTLIRPGLRLISMNMNFCSKLIRIFLHLEHDLKWLLSTLKKAEDNKEKVHIIGHIPPGSSTCANSWKKQYYKIINRYESTVTAQFFGHTHADEFQVYYDLQNTSRPFGVGFIGPSVTPYTYRNPAYKVYNVEGDYEGSQRYVLDHETWYLDLLEANKKNVTKWRKLYSARDEYKLTSVFPEEMDHLYKSVKKLYEENSKKYFKNYWTNSIMRPDFTTADTHMLCNIRSCDMYGEEKFVEME